MYIKVLKSKLHGATVTDARLDYMGSLAIDSSLMAAAEIAPYECVMVADLDNGNRLQTYVVPAPAGSGDIVVLGAAAHLIKRGDTVIIFGFGYYDRDELEGIEPKVIILDEKNRIKARKP